MDEQILVKSYSPRTGKLIIVLMIIGVILSALIFTGMYFQNRNNYTQYQETYKQHRDADSCGWSYDSCERCYRCKAVEKYSSAITMTLCEKIVWAPVLGLPLLGLLIKLLMTSYSLTVTDKRVYCKNLWIFHVCLPVDSITAVSRVSLFGIVAISAPSGHILISFERNARVIYNTINDLLIERQKKL